MISSIIDRIVPAASSSSHYGTVTKNFVEQLVADIPFLTIETVNTDTTSTYDATLAYSFDSTTKVRLFNATTQLKCAGIVDGTEGAATSTGSSIVSGNSQIKMKTFLGTKVALVLWVSGTSADYNYFWLAFGKVNNIYDNNAPTFFPALDASSVSAIARVKNGPLSFSTAYPAPRGVWGGNGHLYAAVPRSFILANNETPICGFVEGTDTFYALYDNGNYLNFSQGEIVIDGHSFFALPQVTGGAGKLAIRLS